MKKRQMFFRMVTASLMRRKSRMLVALLAIAIGAAILSGLVTIYYDVPRQMGSQFRNYGANMLVTPKDESFTLEDMNQAADLIADNELVGVTPYRYETVRIHEQPILTAGIDMEQAQKTSPYWSVDGEWATGEHQVMIGASVADDLNLKVGDTVSLVYAPDEEEAEASEADTEDTADTKKATDTEDTTDATASTDAAASTDSSDVAAQAAANTNQATETNTVDFEVSGIVNTGGSEEDYVYIAMTDMEELTGIEDQVDLAELSISTNSDGLKEYMAEIEDNVSSVNASLVKRVTASETTVLTKLQALVLLVTIVVLALTMISVATTMTAVVTERRREIGLRKALGATDKEIVQEFMGEGLMLGGFGGLLGAILGFVFAQIVSINVFSSSISFRPLLLPITIVAAMAVTAVACMIPIKSATKVDPALVLKGE